MQRSLMRPPCSAGPSPAPSAVAFSPDGTMFVTGAEEGNVRLHHFDADYVSGPEEMAAGCGCSFITGSAML